MTTRKKLVTDNWKSIGALIALVLFNALVDLNQADQPWPTDLEGWGRWATSIVVGTLLVYGAPANTNRPRPRRRRRPRKSTTT